MKNKKKSIVLGAITLVLCLAVFLNINLQQSLDDADIPTLNGTPDGVATKTLGEAVLVGENSQGVTANASGYFASARLSRKEARDEAMSILQSTIENDKSSPESKKNAEETIAVMASNSMKESNIENLVIAKGFPECVAMLSDDGLNVIVASSAETLSPEDVARIRDIATAETSLNATQIHIVKSN